MPFPIAMLMGLASPKNLMIAGAALLALVLVYKGAGFISDTYEAEARVVQLEQVESGLREQLATQDFLIEEGRVAQAEVDAAREEAVRWQTSYRDLRASANNGDRNEVVPDSLARTLSGLRGLSIDDGLRTDVND